MARPSSKPQLKVANPEENTTPLMRQYYQTKAKYPDWGRCGYNLSHIKHYFDKSEQWG
jgi:hypothetical protein